MLGMFDFRADELEVISTLFAQQIDLFCYFCLSYRLVPCILITDLTLTPHADKPTRNAPPLNIPAHDQRTQELSVHLAC